MGYGRGDDQRSEKKRKKGGGGDRGVRRRKTENKEMNNKGEGVKESYTKVNNFEKTGRKDKRRGNKKSYEVG